MISIFFGYSQIKRMRKKEGKTNPELQNNSGFVSKMFL
jgi:hypothetical protein